MTTLTGFSSIQEGLINAFGSVYITVLIMLFALVILYFVLSGGSVLLSLALGLMPFAIIALTTESNYSPQILAVSILIFGLLLATGLNRILNR